MSAQKRMLCGQGRTPPYLCVSPRRPPKRVVSTCLSRTACKAYSLDCSHHYIFAIEMRHQRTFQEYRPMPLGPVVPSLTRIHLHVQDMVQDLFLEKERLRHMLSDSVSSPVIVHESPSPSNHQSACLCGICFTMCSLHKRISAAHCQMI